MAILSDTQKIGAALCAFGAFFLFLGVMLFFDRGLLALGNLMFLCGVLLVTGIRRWIGFFFTRQKLKASVMFFSGILLIMLKFALLGFVLEFIGSLYLFWDIFPATLGVIRNIPVVNLVLQLPVIKPIVDRILSRSGLPV